MNTVFSLFLSLTFLSSGSYELVLSDTLSPNLEVLIVPCDSTLQPVDSACLVPVKITATGSDAATPPDDLVYSYKIDLYSDASGAFGYFDLYAGRLSQKQFKANGGLTGSAGDCQSFNIEGYCNPYAFEPDRPFNADGHYPVGEHTIYYEVMNGDSMMTVDTSTMNVEDCQPPEIECKRGLVEFTMPPRGLLEILIDSLVWSGYDNCTPGDSLKYYFNGDPDFTTYPVNCDTFDARGADDVILVDLHIISEDEGGNASECVMTVKVYDDQGVCGLVDPRVRISGKIENPLTRDRVKGAKVYVTTRCQNQESEAITKMDGSYSTYLFSCFPIPYVQIRPEMYENPWNGVSTADMVGILRYLLGKEDFNGYQMIAADVNNDQRVSVADIVALKKLKLGLAELSDWDQKSWRFVNADLDLDNVLHPWPLIEFIEIQNVNSAIDVDFHGIKIGDVNGDAISP